jgi:hypothetical protein
MDVSALQTDDIETTSVRRATLYRAFRSSPGGIWKWAVLNTVGRSAASRRWYKKLGNLDRVSRELLWGPRNGVLPIAAQTRCGDMGLRRPVPFAVRCSDEQAR